LFCSISAFTRVVQVAFPIEPLTFLEFPAIIRCVVAMCVISVYLRRAFARGKGVLSGEPPSNHPSGDRIEASGHPARRGANSIRPFHSPDHLEKKIKFGEMGRTRTRSKNQRHIPTKTSTTESSNASSSTTPSVPALISKAQSIIEQCDYDLAGQFIQRILQKSPKNVEAREMLGVVQLELGQVQEAREVCSNVLFLVLH